MILLDKPFTVGQFISTGSRVATVEKIGVRSTHLQHRGELVVVNNSSLTGETIQNFAEKAAHALFHRRHLRHHRGTDESHSP